jgi:hypothetical protein
VGSGHATRRGKILRWQDSTNCVVRDTRQSRRRYTRSHLASFYRVSADDRSVGNEKKSRERVDYSANPSYFGSRQWDVTHSCCHECSSLNFIVSTSDLLCWIFAPWDMGSPWPLNSFPKTEVRFQAAGMQPPGSILLREGGSRSDPRSVSSLPGLTARGSIRQGCWHRPGPRLAKLNSLILSR